MDCWHRNYERVEERAIGLNKLCKELHFTTAYPLHINTFLWLMLAPNRYFWSRETAEIKTENSSEKQSESDLNRHTSKQHVSPSPHFQPYAARLTHRIIKWRLYNFRGLCHALSLALFLVSIYFNATPKCVAFFFLWHTSAAIYLRPNPTQFRWVNSIYLPPQPPPFVCHVIVYTICRITNRHFNAEPEMITAPCCAVCMNTLTRASIIN